MIPATHPVVRAMAEEMAKEIRVDGVYPTLCDEFATLLTDLTRPATRDAWVRWLVEQEQGRHDRACASPALRSDAVVRWDAYDRAQIQSRFLALRDNPETLTAAVRAALETM